MSVELKARLRRNMDRVWNQGDAAAIDELYTADIVRHQAAPGSPAGIEGVRLTIDSFRAAIPDLQYEMEELIVDGDLAAMRWSLTGTQEGEVMGTAATGEKMTMSGVSMVRIADGKIAELWTAMTPSN